MKTTIISAVVSILACVMVSPALSAPAPNAEAEQEILAFYRRYLTPCSEHWYVDYKLTNPAGYGESRAWGAGLINLQRLAVDLVPYPLNETDLLNGLEWRGMAKLSSPSRYYNPNKRSWSAWDNPGGLSFYNDLRVEAMKNHGQWTIRFPSHGESRGEELRFARIDCAKLPQ